jgi:hypothetical protein
MTTYHHDDAAECFEHAIFMGAPFPLRVESTS